MTRDGLVEAGSQAMHDLFNRPGTATNREYAAAVVDAVEPLIRADERERSPIVYERDLQPLADLRAKVEVLLKDAERMEWDRDAWMAMAYRDVLVLIDGGGDE